LNLLAVSWEMPPMHGPRATQVARTLGALSVLGWRSTVVCLAPRRGGPHWRDGMAVVMPDGVDRLGVSSPEEWTIVRAAWRLMPAWRDRPDSKWVWIGRAARAAAEAASRTRFEGLVTFAQPWSDHLIGLRVRRTTSLPWVAHFSDPWVDSPYSRLSDARRADAERMEAEVVREAAALVFVTEETADLVMKKYPADWRRKVAVVPHGFVPAPLLAAAAAARRSGPVRVVYTGRFYDGVRTPLPLLRALAQLNRRQPLAGVLDISFVGPHVTGFSRDAALLGLEEFVHFRERVSNEEATAIAADADALLVIDAPTVGPSPFLPSKLVDYLPLRKPMLGITPTQGATAALLARLGCATAPPDNEDAIAAALSDLVQQSRNGTLSVGAQFDFVAGEYDIRRTVSQLSAVFTRAFANQPS
jgi:hypothetical protein